MRIPVAIYPYCSELLPLVKYFEVFQEKYKIQQLISPPGLGLNGKDAAYVRNHPPINQIVTDVFNADDPLWDVLILTQVLQPGVIHDEQLSSIAEETLSTGKNVIYYINCEDDIPQHLISLKNKHNTKLTFITEELKESLYARRDSNYAPTDTPVILVAGLTSHEETLDVLISLASAFKMNGFKPTVITKCCASIMLGNNFHNLSYIINDKSKTESDKIVSLNLFIRDLEHVEIPEVILIEAPDSIIRYNNIAPNGFGIHTYMLCQAVTPDYFICCVPCDLLHDKLISDISNDMSIRFGSAIDAVHISNILVDSANVLQTREVTIAHTDLSVVQKYMDNYNSNANIPVFNCITEGADRLVTHLTGEE